MGPISVAVARGGVVESRHRVHAVVVAGGKVVRAAGDPDLVTFWRSGAKPFQALPLVRAAPELADEEVAVACASHEALPEQLAAVRSLLARARAAEEDLECGPEAGSKLRHNCSGKHAGMLLVSRERGWPTAGYRLATHPLQRELFEVVAGAASFVGDELATATDGCGVPTFALPLSRMALAFTRLPALEGGGRVLRAMRARPDLVGGPTCVDTALMLAVPGTVAKRGAEGLLCGLTPDGAGFALKAEDGSSRALPPAAAAFLGAAALADSPLENSRGERVGELVVERG